MQATMTGAMQTGGYSTSRRNLRTGTLLFLIHDNYITKAVKEVEKSNAFPLLLTV